MAVFAAIAGTIFWFQFRQLDAEEDELNMLAAGSLDTEKQK